MCLNENAYGDPRQKKGDFNSDDFPCVFVDDFDGNNGRRHVAYIEMLILAGPAATFWRAGKWWHAKENLTRSRIVSLAGATATFCEIINFRNPELCVSLGTKQQFRSHQCNGGVNNNDNNNSNNKDNNINRGG